MVNLQSSGAIFPTILARVYTLMTVDDTASDKNTQIQVMSAVAWKGRWKSGTYPSGAGALYTIPPESDMIVSRPFLKGTVLEINNKTDD